MLTSACKSYISPYYSSIVEVFTRTAYQKQREIGADQHPVSLADLHAAYLRANPGIGKRTTQDSFGATINYHTINMRSRFPNRSHKQKPTSWLTRPVFKRVAYGRYMLLSPDELALFHRRVEESDPRIYEDEYDIDDLA